MADEVTAEAPKLKIRLVERAKPEDCRLVVNQAAQDALSTAPTEAVHSKLLGPQVMQHLKDHHNYGKSGAINLQHEIHE